VKEKPIIFSAPMVRAILEGRKTQTRRVIKPQPKAKSAFEGFWTSGNVPEVIGKYFWVFKNDMGLRELDAAVKPRHNAGNILWGRETWGWGIQLAVGIVYKADKNASLTEGEKWKPSIRMPREIARLFLEVKGIRVERLYEITNKDAIREGVSATATKFGGCQARDKPDRNGKFGCPKGCNCFNARENFAGLWDSLNAKRGYSWYSNPWVWVIEFEKAEKFMPLK
jgi:hypothetical protein